MRYQPLVALSLALLLAACDTAPRREPPAPISTPDGAAAPPPPAPPGMEIRPYRPPSAPQQDNVARPVPNRAVAVLQRRADDQQRQGDLAGAAASLERALRIAPRDATLWHQLAKVRERQGRYGQAADLAAKSNSLAAGLDAELVRENWRLIARVRRAAGDLAGARAAEARAR